jgi:hypothetical protein
MLFHGLSKLTDADAEQMETQHWVGEALDCEYLSVADAAQLNSGLEEIGRMLIHDGKGRFVLRLTRLCSPRARRRVLHDQGLIN